MANGSSLLTALQPVRPGDLIEADFFNNLIGAIQDLDDRITKLQAECRKSVSQPGDTGIRPIIIDTAIVKVGTPLAFKVTGKGLDPADLEDRFVLAGIPFKPEKLKGIDEAITFAADPAQFAEAGRSTETGNLMAMVTERVQPEISLTISAKRGVSATHLVEVAR